MLSKFDSTPGGNAAPALEANLTAQKNSGSRLYDHSPLSLGDHKRLQLLFVSFLLEPWDRAQKCSIVDSQENRLPESKSHFVMELSRSA